jgi:hypothetical protein
MFKYYGRSFMFACALEDQKVMVLTIFPPILSDLPVTGFAGFGWVALGYVTLSDIGLRSRSLHMGRRIHPCTEVPDNNYVKVRM